MTSSVKGLKALCMSACISMQTYQSLTYQSYRSRSKLVIMSKRDSSAQATRVLCSHIVILSHYDKEMVIEFSFGLYKLRNRITTRKLMKKMSTWKVIEISEDK